MTKVAAYDTFICHASEDKLDVATPLAAALRNHGLTVWYDEFVLKLGDSLRREITRGLSASRFAIVILSPHFFEKSWPQYELDGLTSLESSQGSKLILPVWHNVDVQAVLKFSPTLADRLAVRTSLGIDSVARQVLAVVRSVDTERPASTASAAGVSLTPKEREVLRTLKVIFSERPFSRSDVNRLIDASDRFWSIFDDFIARELLDVVYDNRTRARRFVLRSSR